MRKKVELCIDPGMIFPDLIEYTVVHGGDMVAGSHCSLFHFQLLCFSVWCELKPGCAVDPEIAVIGDQFQERTYLLPDQCTVITKVKGSASNDKRVDILFAYD